VIVALALSLTGLVLWKRWEAATPADEQFAVNDGAGDGDDKGAGPLPLAAAPGLQAGGGNELEDSLLPAAQAGTKPLLDGWR
jgi:hypothetical protein